jgi:hypothetical protein
VRARRRGKPLSRSRVVPPPGADLGELASRARYEPSAEHKDRYTTTAGVRRLRVDASPCPPEVTQDAAQVWLREALAAGDVGGPWLDQPFPQYAWKRVGDLVFEARLTNSEQGWFKGYPLDRTQWPTWLR